MRAPALLLVTMATVFSVGCGASSGAAVGSSSQPTAPVTTQPSTYSDASVMGNYSYEDSGGLYSTPTQPPGPLETVIGSFVTDGKGNITSGSEIDQNVSYPSNYQTNDENAYFTFSGNYTINTDGTGTVQLSLTCVPAPVPYPDGLSGPMNVTRCQVGTALTVIAPMTVTANGAFTFSMLPYGGTVEIQVNANKK